MTIPLKRATPRPGPWLIAVLTLVGCQGSDRICTVPKPMDESLNALIGSNGTAKVVAARVAAESCVHRWAYRLAGSPDTASVVASAAVAGCEDAPAYNVRARMVLLAQNNMVLDGGTPEEELKRLRGLALFHVVQARSGKCPVPG